MTTPWKQLKSTPPAIVGTVITKQGMQACVENRQGANIVECRLDYAENKEARFDQCRALIDNSVPLLVTLRHKKEGGLWNGEESVRLEWLRKAMEMGAAVDIELSSQIASEVVELAESYHCPLILSFHDFSKTPSIGLFQEKLSELRTNKNCIIKIVTFVKQPGDILQLLQYFEENPAYPLCVMGMGPLGKITRVLLAVLGSCLAYGYLDKPVAPGQLSCIELNTLLNTLKKEPC